MTEGGDVAQNASSSAAHALAVARTRFGGGWIGPSAVDEIRPASSRATRRRGCAFMALYGTRSRQKSVGRFHLRLWAFERRRRRALL
eukprot:6916256-Prymnesium_polylepis.1